MVQDKSERLRDLAQNSSKQIWDKAIEKASPQLEKLPEIKQLLSENASKFITAGALSLGKSKGEAEELFSKVKEVAEDAGKGDFSKDKHKLEELTAYIRKKAEEAGKAGDSTYVRNWESLQEWVKSVPGGEEVIPFLHYRPLSIMLML